MTLEELQAENLRLSEENSSLKTNNDKLTNDITTMSESHKSETTQYIQRIDALKEHNNQLFLKVKSPVENNPTPQTETTVDDVVKLMLGR